MARSTDQGGTAVVTGVSRPRGIGAAVCRALVRDGWDVVASGWPQFDREAPWSDPATDQVETLIDDLARTGRFRWLPVDLEIPTAPVALLDAVEGAGGSVTALVVVHAGSVAGGLCGPHDR